MKRGRNRAISTFIALTLLLTLLWTTPALAADYTVADEAELTDLLVNGQPAAVADGDTITLTGSFSLTGVHTLAHSVTIKAASGTVTLTADSSRHFDITADVTVTFDGVVLDGASSEGGITTASGTTVTIDGAKIQNCASSSRGGGISAGGDLTLTNSTVKNCSAVHYGGGLFSDTASNIYYFRQHLHRQQRRHVGRRPLPQLQHSRYC